MAWKMSAKEIWFHYGLPYVIGRPLYFHSVVFFFFLLFFLALSQRSEIGCVPYFHTWCGPSVNLECRYEMCCTRLAENTRRKKVAKNRHLTTIAQLCRAISSQLRRISTIRKKLVKQQYALQMSPQYGELRPTSGWDRFGSLGHPTKCQLVSRLDGSVTARHVVVGVSQTLRRWIYRGRHLRSAGRPSRWALAHISSQDLFDGETVLYNALLHSNGHGFHSMCWRQLASYQKVQVFTPLRDAIFVFRCMRCQHADRHKNLASQFFVPCRTSVGVAKVAYSPPFCHEKIGTVFKVIVSCFV